MLHVQNAPDHRSRPQLFASGVDLVRSKATVNTLVFLAQSARADISHLPTRRIDEEFSQHLRTGDRLDLLNQLVGDRNHCGQMRFINFAQIVHRPNRSHVQFPVQSDPQVRGYSTTALAPSVRPRQRVRGEGN